MSSPLVVHILPTLNPYGAERIALELAARLPERGFRTRLLVLMQDGALRDELRDRDVRWTLLAEHAHPRTRLMRALRTTLFGDPERMPAVVHTHLFGADFWTAMTSALQGVRGAHRPRFVSTAHSIDHDDSTLRRLARRWSMRRMDRVVAISDEVARYVKEDLAVPARRVRLISNGVDLSKLSSRGAGPFRDVPRLLMVGRLEPQKGHEIALRALAGVESPWRLEIAGDGHRERELRELCETLGIASRVHFLGRRDDVPELLAQADLFLFPSRWEGMGLALAEAIVAGVPVLASDLPVFHNMLPPDCRIDPASIEAWRTRITEVLADSHTAITRAHRLATPARKRYDIGTMVDRYAELYKTLL